MLWHNQTALIIQKLDMYGTESDPENYISHFFSFLNCIQINYE